jgi:hypothetical protein
MRKNRRDFKREASRSPFELSLENPIEGRPDYVTFKDPNKLDTRDAYDLQRTADGEEQLRLLLSEDDFAAFWDEWSTAPIDETNALLEEVFEHYGVSPGKRRR